MSGRGFRLVPKMIDAGSFGIWIVLSNGESKQIGYFLVPSDAQFNDNLYLADEICKAMRTRIRKSI